MTSTLEINVPAIKERVTRILKDPKAEWPIIAAEPTTTEQLYKGYVGPLAAIPAVAGFIGMSIIGTSLPFVGWVRTPFFSGIGTMVLTFVMMLVSVYVCAVIIDKLAPTFESTPNQMQALKLTGYSMTASFVAGIFNVIPALGVLAALGGLYSIYLLYTGLPVMMKTPEGKVIPYLAVAVVVSIAVMFVLMMIVAAMTGAGMILG